MIWWLYLLCFDDTKPFWQITSDKWFETTSKNVLVQNAKKLQIERNFPNVMAVHCQKEREVCFCKARLLSTFYATPEKLPLKIGDFVATAFGTILFSKFPVPVTTADNELIFIQSGCYILLCFLWYECNHNLAFRKSCRALYLGVWRSFFFSSQVISFNTCLLNY